MADYTHYLLYTDNQIRAFREEFAELIECNRSKYREWIETLDYQYWHGFVPPGCSENKIRFIVGLLCILYLDGEVNIVFQDKTAEKIRRNPNDDEFWAQWKKVAEDPQ